MKRFLSVIIAVIFAVTSLNVGTLAAEAIPVFKDIKGHWAEQTIMNHQEKGMLKGYLDGTFKPDQTMRRSELITLLNRYFGLTNSAADNFQDVPKTAWYADEAARAKYYGYIDTLTADPNSDATREAVVQMFSLIIDIEEQSAVNNPMEFKDTQSLTAEKRKRIEQFAQMGYLKGYPDGTFNPGKTINRAEIMTIAESVLGYIVTNQKDLDHIPEGTKKITIINPNIKIENKTIATDIYVSPGVNGAVIIKNCTIKGKLEISGGTADKPVILDNVKADKVVITKAKDKPSIEIMSSQIKELKLKSETTVKTDEKTTIDTAKIQSKLEIKGKGEIRKAYIGAKDVVIEKRPDYVEVTEKEVSVKISDKEIIQETDDTHKSTGHSSDGSSGSSSGNSKIAVTGVTISGSTAIGSTLASSVTPTGATVTKQWQRENASGTFEDITGSTSDTYVTSTQDEDKKIRLIVTGSGNYTGTVTSNVFGPVDTDPILAKIRQGYIPVANKTELKQMEVSAENTFGAGTNYEKKYLGGLNQKYIQVSDIDLAGDNFVPIGYHESTDTASEFTGTYDGNTHKISNLNIDRDKKLQGLFSKLGNGSAISGITINKATLKTSSRTGALAGETNGATIKNSKISDVSFDFYESVEPENKQKEYIGGYVGKATNTSFQSSQLDGFTMLGDSVTDMAEERTRVNIGGIVGMLDGGEMKDTHVKNMRFNAANKADEWKWFYVFRFGGLAGAVQNSSESPLTVDNCSATNLNITFAGTHMDCPGGLIGSMETPSNPTAKGDITIRNSTASGEIYGKGGRGVSFLGGFVGVVTGTNTPRNYILFENCNTSVNINDLSNDPSWADTASSHGTGGFAGHLNHVKTVDCFATGNLDDAFLAGAGGFSGYISDSTIERCYANGNVLGYMGNGGFAGSIINSEIKQCYATGRLGKSTKQTEPVASFGVAGFVPFIKSSNVSDCYYSGDIGDADSVLVSGFANNIMGNATVKNVYFSGVAQGEANVSAFSYAIEAGSTVIQSYWNLSKNSAYAGVENGAGDVTGIDMDAFIKKVTFSSTWDISEVSEERNTIWKIKEGEAYPYLIQKNWGLK